MSATTPQLAKALGRWQLLGVGIGAVIGSGIFVAPGPVAALFAGPALVFSLVIAAFGCALVGLCYAELATMFPLAGSAYAYTLRSFGRLAGWLVGWLLVLEYLFAAAILAVAWSEYFTSFLADLGIRLPRVLIDDSTSAAGLRPLEFGTVALLAPCALSATALIALRNVQFSATINAILACMKVGIVLLVIIAGAWFVNADNWHPFIPPNTGHWGQFGVSGVVRGAAVIFYVYLGFDTVSVAAQEARNPQRDIPFAILGTLLICTGLFAPISLVLTGLTSYHNLNVAEPVAVALQAVSPHLRWLRPIVEGGVLIGMFSVLIVVLMAQSRILYSMALDGLVPRIFGRIHPRFRTPAIGTCIVAAVATVIAALLPISLLQQILSIGALAVFIAVAVSVLALRRSQPSMPRPFRTPLVPTVPVGAIAICGGLMIGLPATTWLSFGLWMALGLVIYFVYGQNAADRGNR